MKSLVNKVCPRGDWNVRNQEGNNNTEIMRVCVKPNETHLSINRVYEFVFICFNGGFIAEGETRQKFQLA